MLLKKQMAVTIVFIILLVLTGCSKNIYQIEVSDKIADHALEIALNKEGNPYEWGERGPEKFDCSGLITWSYKKAIEKDNIFRVDNEIVDDVTMEDLYNWNVRLLPLDEIKKGDIIFITNEENKVTHGGLFIKWIDDNTFEFVNASSYYEKVVIDRWKIDEKKRDQWFIGAGRFLVSH